MTVTWDDDLDAIFGGDLTAGLGSRTPAAGAPPNKTRLLLLNGALAKKGVRQTAKTARKPQQ